MEIFSTWLHTSQYVSPYISLRSAIDYTLSQTDYTLSRSDYTHTAFENADYTTAQLVTYASPLDRTSSHITNLRSATDYTYNSHTQRTLIGTGTHTPADALSSALFCRCSSPLPRPRLRCGGICMSFTCTSGCSSDNDESTADLRAARASRTRIACNLRLDVLAQ